MDAIAREGYYQITDLKIRRRSHAEDQFLRSSTSSSRRKLSASGRSSTEMTADDWSHEETDDPLYADRRNFYKVEKWSRDGRRVEEIAVRWEQSR